jgi:hypothetical protein
MMHRPILNALQSSSQREVSHPFKFDVSGLCTSNLKVGNLSEVPEVFTALWSEAATDSGLAQSGRVRMLYGTIRFTGTLPLEVCVVARQPYQSWLLYT